MSGQCMYILRYVYISDHNMCLVIDIMEKKNTFLCSITICKNTDFQLNEPDGVRKYNLTLLLDLLTRSDNGISFHFIIICETGRCG